MYQLDKPSMDALNLIASRSDLWEIVTALRGPDDLDPSLIDLLVPKDDPGGIVLGASEPKEARSARLRFFVKCATTAVIRQALFPDNLHLGVLRKDQARYVEIREVLSRWASQRTSLPGEGTHHFINHCRTAFAALGLSWDMLNIQPEKDKGGNNAS